MVPLKSLETEGLRWWFQGERIYLIRLLIETEFGDDPKILPSLDRQNKSYSYDGNYQGKKLSTYL